MHRHLVTGLALVVLLHSACHTGDEGPRTTNGTVSNTGTSTPINSGTGTALATHSGTGTTAATDSGTGTTLATASGTGTTLATASGTGTALAADSSTGTAVALATSAATAVATNSISATALPTDLGTAWKTTSATSTPTETNTWSQTATMSPQTAPFSASATSTAKDTATATCRKLPAAPPAGQACGLLVDSSGDRLAVDVTADVTVDSVGVVTASRCGDARRIELAANDGRTFKLDLSVTGLPADFIKAGDRLALKMTHWSRGLSIMSPPVSQSVVLTREGKTVLVTWSGTGSALSATNPVKSADAGAPTSASVGGLELVDAGTSCAAGAASGAFCGKRSHVAQMTIGSQSVLIDPGTTLAVSGMQVVLGDYYDAVDTGICDSFSQLRFAAFAL